MSNDDKAVEAGRDALRTQFPGMNRVQATAFSRVVIAAHLAHLDANDKMILDMEDAQPISNPVIDRRFSRKL